MLSYSSNNGLIAVSQLCAVDLARSNVLGDIPILGIAFAPPKVCNKYLADWVDSMHPKLRVLRVYGPNDLVPKVPPGWLWAMFTGGYHHMGTEVLLSNAHLRDQGLVMKGESWSTDIFGGNVVVTFRQI